MAASRGILFVGSCGYVGHAIGDIVADHRNNQRWLGRPCFHVSAFDVRRCSNCTWTNCHVTIGDATDFGELYYAAKAMDTIVYMAEGDVDDPSSLFSATVHGFYTALMVARARGIRRVILLSSLSVHSVETGGIGLIRDFGEDTPPQCDHPDAITTLMAEWTGRYFAETFDMSVFALRLSGPHTDDAVRAERERYANVGEGTPFWTAMSDVLDAILRTVEIEDHIGFEVINICGDLTGERIDLSKAERILGWRPTI